jgi:choline-phosphate cytidylyltransferase
VSRQLSRGTKRQELNISWLKKNELDIKRHVAELRDNIRQNWTTTGQELSREIQKFWQPSSSRPSSPAPSRSTTARSSTNGAKSPLAQAETLAETSEAGRSQKRDSRTPQREGSIRNKNLDFAAGYAMGLIGGVKGWMEGSKRRNLSDSRPPSPGATGSDEDKSPVDDERRRASEQLEVEMETEA